MGAYYDNLINRVISLSSSNSWKEAVQEWDITDWDEDKYQKTSCICGKEHLRYLFTITNSNNHNILFPIGSSCIQKFQRSELNQTTTLYESLYRLKEALELDKWIGLSSEYFSRKLINHFFESGVFKENEFNQFDSKNDYQFLLDMFNKRDKTKISQNQQKKINGLIFYNIIPYLKTL